MSICCYTMIGGICMHSQRLPWRWLKLWTNSPVVAIVCHSSTMAKIFMTNFEEHSTPGEHFLNATFYLFTVREVACQMAYGWQMNFSVDSDSFLLFIYIFHFQLMRAFHISTNYWYCCISSVQNAIWFACVLGFYCSSAIMRVAANLFYSKCSLSSSSVHCSRVGVFSFRSESTKNRKLFALHFLHQTALRTTFTYVEYNSTET